MKGLSRTEIIGNIGSDAKVGQLSNGIPVVNFNVAVNDSYKDRDGNKTERTEWYKVTIFGKRGEALAPYLKTGMTVFAAGRIKAEAWIGETGEARSSMTLTLGDGRNDFLFLGGGREENEAVDVSNENNDQLFSE